jgi:hypothetical protein
LSSIVFFPTSTEIIASYSIIPLSHIPFFSLSHSLIVELSYYSHRRIETVRQHPLRSPSQPASTFVNTAFDARQN